MDFPHGRAAKFKRALKRPLTRAERDRQLLGGDEGFSPDVRGLPDEMRRKVDSARTDTLFGLLKAEDARVGANRALVGYVVQVLAARLGSYDALHERGLGWATEMERDGDRDDGTHFFVGWTEDAGRIRWQERWFHPNKPQDIPPELVQRFQRLEGCGGVMARADDREATTRADKVRQTVSRWRGRHLQGLGPVQTQRIEAALGPVATHELQTFLEGSRGKSCMLALDGRRVCILDSEGNVYKFNRVETKHLARVGLLPRHWFLPMQWWKKKKEEDQEKEEEQKGKKRIYKGRYDDEDEVGMEEKEEYGG